MSTVQSLGALVPAYVAEPNPRGIFSKRWAVRTICFARVHRADGDGSGNRAKRRVERLRCEFEARCDALAWATVPAAVVHESHVGKRRVNFHA